MPRDLTQERGNVWRGLEQLPSHPDEQQRSDHYEDMSSSPSSIDSPQPSSHNALQKSTSGPEPVKPYVLTLTPSHVRSCVALENATFPPQERCSEDKFVYRFSVCSELSLGLFTSADTSIATGDASTPSKANAGSATTADTASPVYSLTPNRKSVLLGHVIATKTANPSVQDSDMDIPSEWTPEAHPKPTASNARSGHNPHGRTLLIHSLAILPEFQKRGLARLLLKSYIQRMASSGVADRIAIITHAELIPFYESFGFEDRGQSKVTFGGGGWTDMVLDFGGEDSD